MEVQKETKQQQQAEVTREDQCYVIEGDSNPFLMPQRECSNAPEENAKEETYNRMLTRKDIAKDGKTVVLLGSKGLRVPPLTNLFSKPPTPQRRPPTRWLSAKRAFEERPIVLKVMEPKDFSLLQHFTETPV